LICPSGESKTELAGESTSFAAPYRTIVTSNSTEAQWALAFADEIIIVTDASQQLIRARLSYWKQLLVSCTIGLVKRCRKLTRGSSVFVQQ
jgi:hypothetical protein